MSGLTLPVDRHLATLAERYEQEGDVVLGNVSLPFGCAPARAPVLCLRQGDESCEVFISAAVSYHGDVPYLRALFLQEPVTPAARLLLSEPRGLEPALRRLAQLIALAEPKTKAVRPEPATKPPLTDLAAVRAALAEKATTTTVIAPSALRQALSAKVKGQDQALGVLAELVVHHLTRPKPKRPLVILMVGPTGTGKTRSAEALAQALGDLLPTGESHGLVKLNCAEYGERHRVSNLLGAPPGYAGHDQGAPFLEQLKAKPKQIILLDEIEKAHTEFWQLWLGAFDRGELGDEARGQIVSVKQCVFILTSNLRAAEIVRAVAEPGGEHDQSVIDSIGRQELAHAHIAPEIIGRITAFLLFQPLTTDALAEVVALAVVDLAAEYELALKFMHPSVIIAIMSATKTSHLGARAFEYTAAALLSDPFARAAQAHLAGPLQLSDGPPFFVVPFPEPAADSVGWRS